MQKILRIFFLLPLAACASPVIPPAAPHWEMSSAYVTDTLLKSNATLAEELRYKTLVSLRSRDLPNVWPRYRKMAARMGITPLPALYLDTADAQALPQASARFSREGSSYIVINTEAREAWDSRELAAVLGHELVHLKERHVTAEHLAEAFNHPEVSVAHELMADEVGSGPLGSCDPLALEEALRIAADRDRLSYMQKNPRSAQDYNALIGEDHPHIEQRAQALEATAANLPTGCKGRN